MIFERIPAGGPPDRKEVTTFPSIGPVQTTQSFKEPPERPISESVQAEDAQYSPIPKPEDGWGNVHKMYEDAFNAAWHTTAEYSALRYTQIMKYRKMDEEAGIQATVSVKRAKEEFGLTIDRPITFGETMMRLEMKKQREEALEGVEDQFGFDRPLTSLATFLTMGWWYNMTPTSLTLTAGLTKLAGPVGTGGSVFANMARGFKAFSSLRRQLKSAKAAQAVKSTGNLLQRLEKVTPFREAMHKATPIAVANTLEEVGIDILDRAAVGDQYGLEQALVFGISAPFVFGTAGAYLKSLKTKPKKAKPIAQAHDALESSPAKEDVKKAEVTEPEQPVTKTEKLEEAETPDKTHVEQEKTAEALKAEYENKFLYGIQAKELIAEQERQANILARASKKAPLAETPLPTKKEALQTFRLKESEAKIEKDKILAEQKKAQEKRIKDREKGAEAVRATKERLDKAIKERDREIEGISAEVERRKRELAEKDKKEIKDRLEKHTKEVKEKLTLNKEKIDRFKKELNEVVDELRSLRAKIRKGATVVSLKDRKSIPKKIERLEKQENRLLNKIKRYEGYRKNWQDQMKPGFEKRKKKELFKKLTEIEVKQKKLLSEVRSGWEKEILTRERDYEMAKSRQKELIEKQKKEVEKLKEAEGEVKKKEDMLKKEKAEFEKGKGWTIEGTEEYMKFAKMDKRLIALMKKFMDGQLSRPEIFKLKEAWVKQLEKSKEWEQIKIKKIQDKEALQLNRVPGQEPAIQKLNEELERIQYHVDTQRFYVKLIDQVLKKTDIANVTKAQYTPQQMKFMQRSKDVTEMTERLVDGKSLDGLSKMDPDIQQFVRRMNTLEKKVPGVIARLKEISGATHSLGFKNQDLKKLVPLLDESLDDNAFNRMLKDRLTELQQAKKDVTPDNFLSINEKDLSEFLGDKQAKPAVKPEAADAKQAKKDVIGADVGAGKISQIHKNINKVLKELIDCKRGVQKETTKS